jgi:guanosine-3',5'-bis(diphosphate) 3'-pyrophosphohydrolase
MSKYSVHFDRQGYTPEQQAVIAAALELAFEAHEGQKRASGEPYVTHPIAVANTVAGWGLDAEAVMAALLHDVVEDTGTPLERLGREFGPKVSELVDGLTKLRLSATPRPSSDSPRLEASNENLRKLLLASTKDYRVMLIKLADRLHNMRTLKHLPPEKRVRIARESLDIYAPIADRFGMGQLKGELEDLGFAFAKPVEFAELESLVRMQVSKAQQYLEGLKRAMAQYLGSAGVKVLKIEGRQKHYYSIYKKLARADGELEKIYDLIAVRVIVPDVASCYQALGVLHQQYRPLIYRIKDYIAVPKTNGYQSLHTTVFAEQGRITEIQIRTPEMHEAAEYGLAAHFYYDMQKVGPLRRNIRSVEAVPQSLAWVQQLSRLQQASGSEQEFVEGAKLELFTNRIFAFSPKGDLYDLPEGATPLDFAFAVHSDIGLRALGAKVNGRMVPLDGRLENRDVVEVLTRREPAPSRDWLNSVVTSQAKGRIRSWFRAASRETNIASGKLALESELSAWGMKRVEDLPKATVTRALDELHLHSLDDLLAFVGEGTLGLTAVIRRLIPDAAKPRGATVIVRQEPTGRVIVAGENLPYTLAPCCRPVFPQPVTGYVTRGKGVTVHVQGCRNLPPDAERHAECNWELQHEAAELVVAQLDLTAANRGGLLAAVTGAVAKRSLRLHNLTSKAIDGGGQVNVRFGVEVPDMFALSGLMRELEWVPGVLRVGRGG